MNTCRLIALVLTAPLMLTAQAGDGRHTHHASHDDGRVPAWVSEYRGLHFPVSTRHPQAQRFFDQGLLLYYSFSHEAAIQSFEQAAQLDPELAMAHWGIALAAGPYFNAAFTDERNRRGFAAIGKAVDLLEHATPRERGYIRAMADRFSNDEEPDFRLQQQRYSAAVKLLADRYPDDLDAAILYAESRMSMRPWRLWNEDGKPADGTVDIINTLESVLRRDPEHVGANHLYIHALEASPFPERALSSAMRLESLNLDVGHLAHMPAHIYLLLGDYESLVRSNRAALEVDEAWLASVDETPDGYAGYYLHNLEFVVIGHTERGNFPAALEASEKFHELALKFVEERPGADYILSRHPSVLLRFNRLRDVLELPIPDSAGAVSKAYFAYARGAAHTGLSELTGARQALDELRAAIDDLSADAWFRGNDARLVMTIASNVLEARILMAEGKLSDAVTPLTMALAIQDGLLYEETPSWDFSIRELLGAVLVQAGESPRAERVFRDDLLRRPRSPRSLFGLSESLKAQQRDEEAALVEQQFRRVWDDAHYQLAIELL